VRSLRPVKRAFTPLVMLAAFVAAGLLALGTRAPDVGPPTPHISLAVDHAPALGAGPIVATRFIAPAPLLSPADLVDVTPPTPSTTTLIYLRDRVLRL
jgi:hypothetical protein